MKRYRSQVINASIFFGMIILLVGMVFFFEDKAARQFTVNYAAIFPQRLLDAEAPQVVGVIEEMKSYREFIEPNLYEKYEQARQNNDIEDQIRCALALAALSSETSYSEYLYHQLFQVEPDWLPVILNAIPDLLRNRTHDIWRIAEDRSQSPDIRLRAACVLASCDPESPRWQNIDKTVADTLLKQNAYILKQWTDMFRPVKHQLLESIGNIYQDSMNRPAQRNKAINVIIDLAPNRIDILCSFLLVSNREQFLTILPILQENSSSVVPLLRQALHNETPPHDIASGELRVKQKTHAAMALIRLGKDQEIWPLLHANTNPQLRSGLIHLFRSLRVDSSVLINQFLVEADPGIRSALILALAQVSHF